MRKLGREKEDYNFDNLAKILIQVSLWVQELQKVLELMIYEEKLPQQFNKEEKFL